MMSNSRQVKKPGVFRERWDETTAPESLDFAQAFGRTEEPSEI